MFHVYIMTNKPYGTLYIGVTSDIRAGYMNTSRGLLTDLRKDMA